VNLQTIALHHFKTLIAKNGFVAKSCDAPAESIGAVLRPDCPRERVWLRWTALARQFNPPPVLRRPRSLLCKGWMHGAVVVASLDQLDVRLL
jgi:hypothetical protein